MMCIFNVLIYSYMLIFTTGVCWR